MSYALYVKNLCKHYVLKRETVRALRGATFAVENGEYMAVMEPSDSGKRTLSNLLGCLDRPATGSYFLDEENGACEPFQPWHLELDSCAGSLDS